jgi:hypothetical protein
MVPIDLPTLTASLALYEKVKAILKHILSTLPDSAMKTEAAKDLRHADEALNLANAKLAKVMGYPLCARHFPPGIMLDIREDNFPRWKCPECGDIAPKNTKEASTITSYLEE